MQEFYRAFENKYRGSHETIINRLHFYIPLLDELCRINPEASVLDLGCGRGEWLELASTRGWKNLLGVDFNSHMLSAAEENGIPVVNGDALEYLSAQPDCSFDLITAFHFVEHIDFSTLQELTAQCYRVLKPGGVLIYETPNAENIVVGTNNFYLDPTHSKPIPALLLDFMVGYAGFELTNIARLQHAKEYDKEEIVLLYDVVTGVSMDYAIIACKNNQNGINESLQGFLEAKYGYSLKTMLSKYDSYIEKRMSSLRGETVSLTEHVAQLELSQQEHIKQSIELSSEQHAILESIQKELESLKIKNNIIRNELDDIYQSKLWRLKAKVSTALSFGRKKSSFSASKIIHSSFARRTYQALQKVSPTTAEKLRKIISQAMMKSAVKNINKLPGNTDSIWLKDTYFTQSRFVNKVNSIDDDLYICYLDQMINSDALDTLFIGYKPEIRYWLLAIYKAKEIDVNLIESILPAEVIDIDIGYALYMALLGRLPASAEEVKYPVRHLARVIMNSQEYSDFCGSKLNAWFNS